MWKALSFILSWACWDKNTNYLPLLVFSGWGRENRETKGKARSQVPRFNRWLTRAHNLASFSRDKTRLNVHCTTYYCVFCGLNNIGYPSTLFCITLGIQDSNQKEIRHGFVKTHWLKISDVIVSGILYLLEYVI